MLHLLAHEQPDESNNFFTRFSTNHGNWHDVQYHELYNVSEFKFNIFCTLKIRKPDYSKYRTYQPEQM